MKNILTEEFSNGMKRQLEIYLAGTQNVKPGLPRFQILNKRREK